jgi:hypothetical protein
VSKANKKAAKEIKAWIDNAEENFEVANPIWTLENLLNVLEDYRFDARFHNQPEWSKIKDAEFALKDFLKLIKGENK